MYVFVTVAELTGPEKKVSLGQVEDDVTLSTLLQRTLERVDKYIREEDRDVSRHFWFSDNLVAFDRTYLRDIASTVNVTLELRPDHYKVELPGKSPTPYAIDPEQQVAKTIDQLMGSPGSSRCYEILPRGAEPLGDGSSLLSQKTLPYHARLAQAEIDLVVRRKRMVFLWWMITVSAFIGIGLLVGYLSARLLK